VRVDEGLLAALCLPGFARVQFDIVRMTGYPEVNFPIADKPLRAGNCHSPTVVPGFHAKAESGPR
jgi:hypothetical protein